MDAGRLFKNLKNLLIVILVIIIILLRQCSGGSPVKTKVITKIEKETVYDTITQTIPQYIPRWKERILYKDTTIYKDIDTSAILEDYFAFYYYSDTIADDSISVVINDTISENKIKNRNINYSILYPITTVTITKEHYLNKREFYVGPNVGASLNALEYVGIEGLFKGKKRTAISLGIGVDQKFQPQLRLGLYWKLNRR